MQDDSKETVCRFNPVRVEGLSGVAEVAIFATRLEMRIGEEWQRFPFAEMECRYGPKQSWWKKMMRVEIDGYVGERDYGKRYFTWFTKPEITIHTPPDESTNYADSLFFKIHEVMGLGPFATYDRG